MLKALVTGASGFIGSTLIEELSRDPEYVRAAFEGPLPSWAPIQTYGYFRRSSSFENLRDLKFERIFGDFTNFDELSRVLPEIDYIFHLAGTTSANSKTDFFDNNTLNTAVLGNLVQQRAKKLRRFVYVSSLAAGGPMTCLKTRTELDPDQPVSEYGKSKLEGERELLKFKGHFPITIVRPPIVYGPRDKGVFVAFQAASRRFVPLPKPSNQEGHKFYSTIYSRDLCKGIILAALVTPEKVPSGEVFYLSGDDITTYSDLMDIIALKFSKKIYRFKVPRLAMKASAYFLTGLGKITRRTYPFNSDKLRELLPDYWICSNEKAKTLLGFQPEFNLPKGISEAFHWYKEQKWL